MRKLTVMASLAAGVVFLGCAPKTFHHGPMPDPAPYMIHFPELDTNGDDAVTWEEFKQRFPDATANVFEAVDQDGNDTIDHDEWHAFKAAHGE